MLRVSGLEKTPSYLWRQTTKTLNIRHGRTSVTSTNYLSKRLILLTFREQVRNHRLKWIIFKSSSFEYNQVFHIYIFIFNKESYCVQKHFTRPSSVVAAERYINSRQQLKIELAHRSGFGSAPWLKFKDRFEAEWVLASAGPPSGRRWCHWQALYSTGPLGPD